MPIQAKPGAPYSLTIPNRPVIDSYDATAPSAGMQFIEQPGGGAIPPTGYGVALPKRRRKGRKPPKPLPGNKPYVKPYAGLPGRPNVKPYLRPGAPPPVQGRGGIGPAGRQLSPPGSTDPRSPMGGQGGDLLKQVVGFLRRGKPLSPAIRRQAGNWADAKGGDASQGQGQQAASAGQGDAKGGDVKGGNAAPAGNVAPPGYGFGGWQRQQ